MPSRAESFDCIIVGAGISGMLAATVLERAGLRTCILEKGRGLGGRMATRRRDGAVFDHGAQFFTVRDPRFRRLVKGWIELGIVQPWYELAGSGTHYRAAPGMTAIAKHLAAGLEVRRGTQVDRITHAAATWSIGTQAGAEFRSNFLLLTAPVPQSLALLDSGSVNIPPLALAQLEAIRYHRCIAALAILDRPSELDQHGGSIKLDVEPVQWIADNQRKGISPDTPSATIHSTPGYAEAHWDAADPERLPPLLEAAAPYLGAEIVSCHGHRWGFSQPISAFPEEAFVDPERGLAIAGDGLAGGRVEGAAISGLAAAGRLLGQQPRPRID